MEQQILKTIFIAALIYFAIVIFKKVRRSKDPATHSDRLNNKIKNINSQIEWREKKGYKPDPVLSKAPQDLEEEKSKFGY